MASLTQSNEDYLEAILVIGLEQGIVRVRDLAKHLQVTAPSVATAIKKLADEDLVRHESYGHVELTSSGFELAQEIHNRHKLLFRFLHVFLGLDEDTAERDACEIEHGLSPRTITRIIQFLEFIESLNADNEPAWLMDFRQFIKSGQGPRTSQSVAGDSIRRSAPSEKSRTGPATGPSQGQMTLTDVTAGQEAEVVQVTGGATLKRYLLEMGIVPGTRISIRDVDPDGDPIDVVVRGYHLSLKKEEAARITVTLLEKATSTN